MALQNVITLTTIPPRFNTVLPTLQSLCEQDADISKVILALPKQYQKRGFEPATLPDLPAGVEILHADKDFGPATKILPAAQHFQGQDVRLLYCDDDRIYHRDWAARLIAHSERYPDVCVADAGDTVTAIDMRVVRDVPFHRRLNALTLGLAGKSYRRRVRTHVPDEGLVDIAQGYGGVLIKPDFLGAKAFDIPGQYWAVDDIWLSGQMAVAGVQIHKLDRIPRSEPTQSRKLAALLDLEFEGIGRFKLNADCVNYFRREYGVWGGLDAIQGNT